MGNKGNSPLHAAYNPSLEGWMLAKKGEDYNVWRNTSSDEEMEEYRFIINDAKEFDREKQIFEFRYDSPILVSSRYFKQDTQRQLCSTYYRGNLFLQRIPIRLSLIEDLPYPDILHLYHQAFRGFAELHDKMGFFNIEENMICINQEGRVKVWVNGELDKSYPDGALLGLQGTERDMVRKIVQLIDQNTDNRTLPENIGAMLQQADPPTFREADLMVQNFAARYRVIIPTQIDSVLRRDDLLNLTHLQPQNASGLFSTANFGQAAVIPSTPISIPLQHNLLTPTHQHHLPPNLLTTFNPNPTIQHPLPQPQIFSPPSNLPPNTPVANMTPLMSQSMIPQSAKITQVARPQPIKSVFGQRTVSKPATGVENTYELADQNRNNNRINSRSLTVKNNLDVRRVEQLVQQETQSLAKNAPQSVKKNHSSMYSLQNRNQPAPRKSELQHPQLTKVASLQQTPIRTFLAPTQSARAQQRKYIQRQDSGARVVNARSQIIATQPQQHQQTIIMSSPSSKFMQTMQRAQQSIIIDGSQPSTATNPVTAVSSPVKIASTKSPFTKTKHNVVSEVKNISDINTQISNGISSAAKPAVSVIDPSKDVGSFVGNSTILVQTSGPVRGSTIFRSAPGFSPQIQITYESSRLINYDPNKQQEQREPAAAATASTTNTTATAPTTQMTFAEISEALKANQYKSEDRAAAVSHLPVTYSVLKETEEFLAKYHQSLGGNSEFRASLGSQFVLGDESRNITQPTQYNLDRQPQRPAERPIQPPSYEPLPSYTSYQPEYKPVKIEHLDTSGDLKYSNFQQQSNAIGNLRTFENVSFGSSSSPYAAGLDSELLKDLEKFRNK